MKTDNAVLLVMGIILLCFGNAVPFALGAICVVIAVAYWPEVE